MEGQEASGVSAAGYLPPSTEGCSSCPHRSYSRPPFKLWAGQGSPPVTGPLALLQCCPSHLNSCLLNSPHGTHSEYLSECRNQVIGPRSHI